MTQNEHRFSQRITLHCPHVDQHVLGRVRAAVGDGLLFGEPQQFSLDPVHFGAAVETRRVRSGAIVETHGTPMLRWGRPSKAGRKSIEWVCLMCAEHGRPDARRHAPFNPDGVAELVAAIFAYGPAQVDAVVGGRALQAKRETLIRYGDPRRAERIAALRALGVVT